MPSRRPYPTNRRTTAPFFCSTQAWSFFRYGLDRVSSMPCSLQKPINTSLRNSLPLSVSTPRNGNGRAPRSRSTASTTTLASRTEQRYAFRPAAGDIGQHQRPDEAASHRRSTVRDEVGLDEARRRILPIAERAHRNPAPVRGRPRNDGAGADRPSPPSRTPGGGRSWRRSPPSVARVPAGPGSGARAARVPAPGSAATPSGASRTRGPMPPTARYSLSVTASSYTDRRPRRTAGNAELPFRTRMACLRWCPVSATNSSRIRPLSAGVLR